MNADYYVVSTMNQDLLGWRILSGPYRTRTEAARSLRCRSTDMYEVTLYRNAHIVAKSRLAQLKEGIPRYRIGRQGAEQMLDKYGMRDQESPRWMTTSRA